MVDLSKFIIKGGNAQKAPFVQRDTAIVARVQIDPTGIKRDTATLLEMIEETGLLISQTNLETCTVKEFEAIFHFVNWAYMNKIMPNSAGIRPPKPVCIDEVPNA